MINKSVTLESLGKALHHLKETKKHLHKTQSIGFEDWHYGHKNIINGAISSIDIQMDQLKFVVRSLERSLKRSLDKE